MLNTLLAEFTYINSIYQLYEPTIQSAIQLLRTEPVLDKLTTADNPWPKMILPFLGDALQWLMGTTTIEDTTEIKWKVNLLIQEWKQQETIVHIISILNITQYTIQVNKQKLNEVMDAPQKVNNNVNILFNFTNIQMQHLRYHQIYT